MLGNLQSLLGCKRRRADPPEGTGCKRRKVSGAGASTAPALGSRHWLDHPYLADGVLAFLDAALLARARAGSRGLRAAVAARLPHAFREACPNAAASSHGMSLAGLFAVQCGVRLVEIIDVGNLEPVLQGVCASGKSRHVLKLASGYPGDGCVVVISALLAAMRIHSSNASIQRYACLALGVLISDAETRYRGITADLGAVPALAAMLLKPTEVRMVALATLDELSDVPKGDDAFMLMLPEVEAVRTAMQKRIVKVCLGSDLIPNIATRLGQLSPEETSVAIKLLYRLTCTSKAIGTPLGYRAAAALNERQVLASLVAELRRSAASGDEQVHRQIVYVLCFLLLFMADHCRDFQPDSCIFVGSRVLVRDSDGDPWLSGTVAAHRHSEWVVQCDYLQTQSRVWKSIKAVAESTCLMSALDATFQAGIIPSMVEALLGEDLMGRFLAMRALTFFAGPTASPAMRSSIIEAGGVVRLLHFTGFGGGRVFLPGVATEVLGNLCSNCTMACGILHDLGGIPFLIDQVCGCADFDPDERDNALHLLSTLFDGDSRARATAVRSGMVEKIVLFLRRNYEDEDRRWLSASAAWALMSLVFDGGPEGPPVQVPGAEAVAGALVAAGALSDFSRLVETAPTEGGWGPEFSQYLEALRALASSAST